MHANSLAAAVALFALGMVLQALWMLRGRFLPGDARTVALSVGVSLFGLLPFRHESRYEPIQHGFGVCLSAAAIFTAFFRARLLPRIGGRILLAWNILLAFVVLRAGWTSPWLLVPLGIFSALTVVNAFSDMDRAFGWKVFFHAWFTAILVVLAIRGMDVGPLGQFLAADPAVVQRSPSELLLTGGATMYLVTNAFFLLGLVPLPGKHQSWKERMEEIHRHMELLASGYVWEKDDPVRSLAVLVVLPLVLYAASRWGIGIDRVIVPAAIAVMPALAGSLPEAPDALPQAGPRFARPRRTRRGKG